MKKLIPFLIILFFTTLSFAGQSAYTTAEMDAAFDMVYDWEDGSAAIDGDEIADDTIDDDSLDFGDITCVDLTMSDCGAVTATGFTIGSAGIDETELEILDGALLSTTQINYLQSATGTTGTASTNLVFSTLPTITTPTFVTSITMGSAALNEAELEIIDGGLLTTTQLNYLQSATGTTGTATTNLVFSASPTFTGTVVLPNSQALVTPVLGTITSGVGTSLTALNGENLQDDTVDDDSLDFGSITLTDFTFDVGSVSTTEYGYLNGLTGNIQDQLDSGTSGRFMQGVTLNAFTGADATPDVNNGTTDVVQFWKTADTTTITDLDDGVADVGGDTTANHSSFADGDTVVIQCLHAAVFDLSDNTNLKGHGNNDYTCGAGEFILAVFDNTNDYWVLKPSETKTANFSTLRIPNHETTDAALTNLGEIYAKATDDGLIVHMGTAGEAAGEVHISALDMISVNFDPAVVYDSDTQVFLFEVHTDIYPSGITIDEWKVSCNVDPDVEPDLDLKECTAWIGLGGAAVVDVLDTANGVATEDDDTQINGNVVVPAGQFLYLEFDSDPAGTCDQMNFTMIFHAEED